MEHITTITEFMTFALGQKDLTIDREEDDPDRFWVNKGQKGQGLYKIYHKYNAKKACISAIQANLIGIDSKYLAAFVCNNFLSEGIFDELKKAFEYGFLDNVNLLLHGIISSHHACHKFYDYLINIYGYGYFLGSDSNFLESDLGYIVVRLE